MITTFYPPHIGEIEYHVENVSNWLAKNGHKITVLTSQLTNYNSPSVSSSENVEVVRIKAVFPLRRIYPSLSSQGFAFNLQGTIRRLIEKKQIDTVHVHGHHYFFSWQAISAAKSAKVPSILTIHGLYALSPSDSLAQVEEEIFNKTIFKRELKTVSAVIGLTPNIINFARQYGPSTKSYYSIPNGVNQAVFEKHSRRRFLYREKYCLKNGHFVVLFLGRLAPIKGILELAEAAKLVLRKDKRVFFLFVGDGPLRNELAKILQPVQDNASIVGWVSQDKIHELYLASDLFVLPSKSEALPLTILEAMAARLDIISTPVGGVPEILSEYPYKNFIQNNNPQELSQAILQSVSKKQNWAPQSRFDESASYLRRYNWQEIAKQLETIYQSTHSNFDTEQQPISDSPLLYYHSKR